MACFSICVYKPLVENNASTRESDSAGPQHRGVAIKTWQVVVLNEHLSVDCPTNLAYLHTVDGGCLGKEVMGKAVSLM